MTAFTEDRFLGGRVTIRQPAKGYRAGVDPVLLAAAVPAKEGQSVLELGTGVGTALVCLGARVENLTLAGVEIQPALAELAQLNLSNNGLSGEVHSSDLADLSASLRGQSFDHVIANPPYFRRGQGTPSNTPSRELGRGEATPLALWLDVATRRLIPGGRLTIIQRAARLRDVLTACDGRLGSVVVKPIAPRTGRDAELIILSAKKGGRAEMRLSAPFILHEGKQHDGDRDSYTPAARAILREGAALPT